MMTDPNTNVNKKIIQIDSKNFADTQSNFDLSNENSSTFVLPDYPHSQIDVVEVPSYSEQNINNSASFHSTPTDFRKLVVTLIVVIIIAIILIFLLLN